MRWAVLLGSLLLAPLAAEATHVHGDRYMIIGRVLDDEGLPASLVPVRGELVGTPQFAAAQARPTNCQGDYVLVFDVEALGDADVRVTVLNRTFESGADPVLRRSFAPFDVAGKFTHPDCAAWRVNFTASHLVTGRLLRSNGEPRADAEVIVSIQFRDGGSVDDRVRTNVAGDFAAPFRSARFGPGDRADVTSGGEVWSVPLDHHYRFTIADHTQEPTLARSLAAALILVAIAGAIAGAFLVKGRRDHAGERTSVRDTRRRQKYG